MIDNVLHLPYKFKEFPNNVKIFQCHDINTFQIISSNPVIPSNNIITMIHQSNASITQRRNYGISIDNHQVNKRTPVVARFYNQFMGGTGRFDQMLATHSFRRRCNRWTIAFHYFALNAAATNAYIIYRTRMKELDITAMTNKEFIQKLTLILINHNVQIGGQTLPNTTRSFREMRSTTPLNYDNQTDWLPLLLKKTEPIPVDQRAPLISQPIHLKESRFHYLALIKTPLREVRRANGKLDHSWRPKCIKSGCTTSTDKCCRVCHVPLCAAHFGIFRYSFEMAKFLRVIN